MSSAADRLHRSGGSPPLLSPAPAFQTDGSDEGRRDELLRRARELDVSASVRILGWVDDEALRKVYDGALATVSTSTYEGYGLPVAESLSHGLVTIASDLPPHREIAADAALYFEPGNAASLAQHMRQVVERADVRERRAEAALARSRMLARAGPRWADVIVKALG